MGFLPEGCMEHVWFIYLPQLKLFIYIIIIILIYTSRTLKFTLLTLFQHDTCGLQRIGLTRPFCAAGTARSDFHTRLNL